MDRNYDMKNPLEVVIAGGGIGGLTVAIALHRAGHKVQVVEKAPAMGWGQGVQVSPPAMALLAELSVAEPVRAAGQVMRSARKLTADGLVLRERAFGRVSGVDQPHVSISRGTLQLVLAEAVKALGIDILLDHGVQSFDERQGSVRATLPSASDQAARCSGGRRPCSELSSN